MSGPILRVDINIIEENTRKITGLCKEHGISVTGVTKVTCGMPPVARALLRGGVTAIGESRLENIHRMRADGITAPFWLLRIPPLSAVEEIVTSVNVSLNSEIKVIRALSEAAEAKELIHDIILMIDLGDLREGIWPDDLLPTVREITGLSGIRLRGLGTNLTCYGGVLPTKKNMQQLVYYSRQVADLAGHPMDILSGGNSSSLDLLSGGDMPAEITNLRLGESLMLGKETAGGTLWPGARPDAFVLEAELIEVKEKPSIPIGERGRDAFGEIPVFEDKGTRLRGILNIGREDVKTEGLASVDKTVSIIGSSSDHLLVDITSRNGEASVGDTLGFLPDYGALLAAMTSAYVKKEIHRCGIELAEEKRNIILAGSKMESPLPGSSMLLGDALENDLKTISSIKNIQRLDSAELVGEFPDNKKMLLLCGNNNELLEILATGFSNYAMGLVWITPSLDDSPLLDYLVCPETAQNVINVLPPENVVIAGLREAGSKTKALFASRKVHVYTMEDIDLLGLRQVIRQSIYKAASGTRGVFLRYNNVATDGGSEGFTRRETYLAMEISARSGLLKGMDISESMPLHTSGEADSLRRYVATVFGRKILG